ncbi:hypothetical protein [Pseudoroseicyclus aestuarii]|uniref:Uncharacterized protein n=1 Tax=Pseudoroseicyclus aestuarii TaxID=1795041 RepID=A0A318T1S0_9RHOB|nr:hypothetical protein [Pseudoroseicyclus aestuarii]PYE85927.1 hypothetical protein DFP88_101601 [Pseudoroseicyclus aestuarii]
MTALKQFARLETVGLWRPEPEAQRREVTVSFGEATLMISDMAGRPLAHWSLPAVQRLNGGEEPALYAPDAEATETLEIDDETMVQAIETVRRAVAAQRPRPGRLRGVLLIGLAVLTLWGAVFWLPGALTRQTLSAVPQARRGEIGTTLLGLIQQQTGEAACRNPLGTEALAALRTRVLGPAAEPVVVLPAGLEAPAVLPGGIIALPRAMIERTQDPAVVAGALLAAAQARAAQDPLATMLRQAGFGTVLTLLTTGDVPPEVLQDWARGLQGAAPQPLPPVEALRAAFEEAEVPSQPWANWRDPSGALAERLAQEGSRGYAPVLSDGNWVSLQGICRG